MSHERMADEKAIRRPQVSEERTKPAVAERAAHLPGLAGLQQSVGNRAVQRLLAQRSGSEPAELDDETAGRINRARGGGQPLDTAVAAQMGDALGQDFSGVRVHTSPEANALSRQLGAQAFTSGSDVFFRAGAYDPHSASGQALIGHELAHVVQQGGQAAGTDRMTVNPPGDIYEQEADGVAKALVGTGGAGEVQRQVPEEEEEALGLAQRQIEEEEEEEPVP